MKHALVCAAVAVAFGTAAGPAGAADLPCAPAEKGTVQLDGLTDDWADVEGVTVGGSDANLSFTLKCNVEEHSLLLLVDVRDNYVVRTKQTRPGEDHIVLALAGRPLTIYPGDARALPTKVSWGATPAKNVKAVSALQEHGYAVELALPLAALPGIRPGMPIPYQAQVADCDSKASLTTERVLTDGGRIVFAEGDSALEAFLKDRQLSRSDVWFDRGLRLGAKEGARVLMAGRILAALTEGYSYIELPARSRADIKDVRLVDLAGDGRQAIVVRYVERGSGGSREILAAYRVGGEIRRVFAAEVGKATGAGRVDDKVTFVRRGRATDIAIDAGTAAGLSAANYHEEPADEVIPVLLPWADERHARYQFSGDEYRRVR